MLVALVLVGCAGETAARLGQSEVESEVVPEVESERAAEAPAGDAYGEALDESIELTALGAIIASPGEYADTVVRTEGHIAQVCQRAGCWMELREGEDGPAVRVPMAGHAFFLPRESAGHHATMQGRVVLSELSGEHRAHLESEGASQTASPLAIHATGVVID